MQTIEGAAHNRKLGDTHNRKQPIIEKRLKNMNNAQLFMFNPLVRDTCTMYGKEKAQTNLLGIQFALVAHLFDRSEIAFDWYNDFQPPPVKYPINIHF